MDRMERFDDIPGGLPRAPRFRLHLWAQYRRGRSDSWHDATTINVSRSGLLLCTTDSIDPESTSTADPKSTSTATPGATPGATRCAALEVRFVLSFGPLDAPLSTVRCRGLIVRVEPRPDAEPGVLMAVTITRYAFRRDTAVAWIAQ
jgi:hypothetical protein